MKILIISQYFWPEGFRINEVAGNLAGRGHQVTVLTGIPNYPSGKFSDGYGLFRPFRENHAGVRVVRAPLVSRGRSKGVRLALNYLSFALSASIVGLLFCRDSYDVIFVYEPSPITVGIPAVLLRAVRKIPVIFWVQDLWPESLEATGAVSAPWILNAVSRLVRFIYRRCDQILVQSEAFRQQVERFGVDPARIHYFPNSAEELFRPVPDAQNGEDAGKMPSGFRVMFAGNIGVAQDFGTILAAAERLKQHELIQWVIVGDGRERDWVASEVKKRGLERSFHLLGRFPLESMPGMFALADAMLVILKNEPIFAMTIPAKIQSYLACGKPIVAAIAGEGARVVEEAGSGIVCGPEAPEALAAAVLKMYSSSEVERRAMGEKGRKYFESHFEGSALLGKLEDWMRNLAVESSV